MKQIFFPSNKKVYDTRGVAQLINLSTICQGMASI